MYHSNFARGHVAALSGGPTVFGKAAGRKPERRKPEADHRQREEET
jgi:hypothetical protein